MRYPLHPKLKDETKIQFINHNIMETLVYIYKTPNKMPQNTTQMYGQLRYKSNIRLPALRKTWYITMYKPWPKTKSVY